MTGDDMSTMTPSELGDALLAHPAFDLRGGMLLTDHVAVAYRVVDTGTHGLALVDNAGGPMQTVRRERMGSWGLVLSDPATVGALRSLAGTLGSPQRCSIDAMLLLHMLGPS